MFNFENIYAHNYFDKCLKRLHELKHISSRERYWFIKLIYKLDFDDKYIEKDEVFEVEFNKKKLEFKEIGLYLFLVTLRNDKGIIAQRFYHNLKTEGNSDTVLIGTTCLNKDLLIKVLKIAVPYGHLVTKAIEELNELGDVDLLNDQTILSINGEPELTAGDLTVENKENVITVFVSGHTQCRYTQCKINQPNINEIKVKKMNINFETVYGLEYFKFALNKLLRINLFTTKEYLDHLDALDTINLSEYEGGVGSTIKLDGKFTGITLTELGLGIFRVTAGGVDYVLTHVDFNVDNFVSSLTERYNIGDKLDKELLLSVVPVVFKDCKNTKNLLEKIRELKEVDLKENSTFLTLSLGWDGVWKFSNERNKIIITLNNNKIMGYRQYMTKEKLATLTSEDEQNKVEVNDVKEEREMIDTQNVKLKDIVNSFDVITNLKDIINLIKTLDPEEKVSVALSDNKYKLEIIPENQNDGMFIINVLSNGHNLITQYSPSINMSTYEHFNLQTPLISIRININGIDVDKLQEFITNSLSMLK